MSEQSAWPAEKVIPLLREVSLFEGLPEEDLRRIAEIVEGHSVAEGEVLFEEGDPGDAYYIVFEGAVEIVKAGASGEEEKLAVRRSGQGFGEMALLEDEPRSASARAVSDSRLLTVPRDSFRRLLGHDTLAIRMMRVLSQSLRALDVRFAAAQRRGGTGGGESVAHLSRLLQRGLLPRNAPRVEGYDIAAGTSLEDDGDGRTAWDFFPLSDGRTGLASYHVRGEGVPPGHQLAVGRALFHELARDEEGIGTLLQRVNRALSEVALEGVDQFMECGLLGIGPDGIEWSGAGRPPAAVIRRDGNLVEFPAQGPPLGMMEGFRYGGESMALGPGDAVLVLSRASQGLFRGAADLVATLHGKPLGEVVSTVHRALRKAHENASRETTVLLVRKQ